MSDSKSFNKRKPADRSFEPSIFVELRRSRGECQPNRKASSFLIGDPTYGAVTTHQGLDRSDGASGACLSPRASIRTRALLKYPPSLDFIIERFGGLYTSLFAVPYYSPARIVCVAPSRAAPELRQGSLPDLAEGGDIIALADLG